MNTPQDANVRATMARPCSVSPLRSEFDDFLYASIGEEKNGMQLSVLSALARQDVDPWAEAASLNRLTAESAVPKLAALIAALSDSLSTHVDSRTIAARLIGLLPRSAAPDRSSPETLPGALAVNRSPAVTYAFFCLMIIVFMIFGESLIDSLRTPEQVDRAPAPISAPR